MSKTATAPATEAEPKRSLFEIGDDMRALDSLLDEVGGDISDADAAAYVDQLFNANDRALASKVDGYCALTAELDRVADLLDEEAKRLAAKAKARRNKRAWLRQRLFAFMQASNIPKINTHRYTVSVSKGVEAHRPITFDRDITPESFATANPGTPYVRRTESYAWDTTEVRTHLRAQEILDASYEPTAEEGDTDAGTIEQATGQPPAENWPPAIADVATLGPAAPKLMIR